MSLSLKFFIRDVPDQFCVATLLKHVVSLKLVEALYIGTDV